MDLTPNQKEVLQTLRQQNCHWIASATEQAWEKGKPYYIDTRVNVKGIRRKFNQGNKEALDS